MMELVKGDILKIAEFVPHTKGNSRKITIGEIAFMDSKKITVKRLKEGKNPFLISFNIADLADRTKHYYKKDNDSWTPIKFNISQPTVRL